MTAPLDEKAEHPRIWLEPAGAPDRCWCSDNQWGDEGVEYILASQTLSAVALPDELDVAKKLKAVIDDFDAEVTAALGREERPDLWDGGVDVHISLIREAHSTIAALRAEGDEAVDRAKVWEHYWQHEVKVKGEVISWCKDYQAKLETAEAEVKRLTQALSEIRELNMSAEDENGHRWANSDLIEQTIVFAMAGARKAMEGGE